MPREASRVPTHFEDDTGDELDRMMRAQRRTEHIPRTSPKDRGEGQRRSLRVELAKPTKGTSTPPIPRVLWSPPSPLEIAFDRALLDTETKRRSLGGSLLSDEAPSRRTSATPTITPDAEYLSVRDLRRSGSSVSDDASERTNLAASPLLGNGLTASVSSTGSDVSSLPSFPDVPQHLSPPVPPLPEQHQVFPNARATPLVVGGLGHPLDERDSLDRRTRAVPSSVATATNRLSMVSESGAPQYEDAPAFPPALAEPSLHASPHTPGAVPGENDAADQKQHAREWVETLVDGPARSLGEIGEEPEDEDERMRQATLSPPPTTSPSTLSISLPFRAPPREPSATSNASLSVPSPTAVHARAPSPVPSTASSAAAISNLLAPPTSPRAAAGHFKPRLTLGRKIGALFGAGAGSARGGIGSRDVVRPPGVGAGAGAGAGTGLEIGEAWDAQERMGSSTGTASGTMSVTGTVPPSPVDALFAPSLQAPAADAGKQNTPAITTAATATGGLDALLARFEAEEKERFRGIAAARAQDALRGRGEVAPV
ncbi:hypothetical protein JCM3770_001659 [Rhodotorula araucariae]